MASHVQAIMTTTEVRQGLGKLSLQLCNVAVKVNSLPAPSFMAVSMSLAEASPVKDTYMYVFEHQFNLLNFQNGEKQSNKAHGIMNSRSP